MPKKDHETLTREMHVMLEKLCKRFDNLEPVLLSLPKLSATMRTNLQEFRRDVRVRIQELTDVVRTFVKGR